MKTLSEHLQDERVLYELAAKQAQERMARASEEMARLKEKAIPVYVPKGCYPSEAEYKEQAEGNRDELRALVCQGRAPGVHLACDHCGTELVNQSPHIVTSSIPSQVYIGCPGCGWLGTMRA